MKWKFSALRLLTILRVGAAVVPVVIFLWLANAYFVPFGRLSLSTDFTQPSPFISLLGPEGRVAATEMALDRGVTYQRLQGTPVEFTVTTPRVFERASVTIEYENRSQPVIELGLEQSRENGGAMKYRTLEQQALESTSWLRTEDPATGITFLQRGIQPAADEESDDDLTISTPATDAPDPVPEFASLDDLIAASPNDRSIAVFGILPSFTLKQYRPSSTGTEISTSLRGPHTMYTYVGGGEPLTFRIWYHDLNTIQGSDSLRVAVASQLATVATARQPDDGNVLANGKRSELQELSLTVPNLPDGSYRVTIETSMDVRIRRIQTSQDLLVFDQNITLAEPYAGDTGIDGNPPGGTVLYADGTKFDFRTRHIAGFQRASVDRQFIDINARNDRFSLTAASISVDRNDLEAVRSALHTVRIPRQDMHIASDRFFAFSPQQFFVPFTNVVPLREIGSTADVDFIIAKGYTPPDRSGFWTKQTAEFDLSTADYAGKQLHFSLALPGIEQNDNVKLHRLRIDFDREPLKFSTIPARLRQYFSQYFSR